MITAENARQQSCESGAIDFDKLPDDVKAVLGDIEMRVQAAAATGQFDTILPGALTKQVQDILKYLGFRILSGDFGISQISW